MKKSFFALLSLLSVGAMSVYGQIQQSFRPGRAVIAGTVVGDEENMPDVLTVFLCDPTVDGKNERNAFSMADSKDFHVAADIFYTQNTTIKCGGRFYNLIISPGDSVFVTIDLSQEDIGRRIVFSGDKAELNNRFTPFVRYLYSLNTPRIDMDRDDKEVIAAYRSYLNAISDSIDVYAKKHQLTPEIVEWGKRDAVYTMANRTFYYTEKQSALASDSIFDIFNGDNFKTMYFPYHLDGYLRTLLNAHPRYSQIGSRDFKAKADVYLEVISGIPGGPSRDYILFSVLKRWVALAPDVVEEMGNSFYGLFDNKHLATRIQGKADSKVDAANYVPTPLEGICYLNAKGEVDQLPKTDIFEWIKKKARGKVVYVDVYATWCGPCRAELPASQALHQEYKDKGVEFVYLNLSSELDGWKALASGELAGCENYFFNETATDMFGGVYSDFFRGYPTYVVIDRDGNLLTRGIPRPSAADEVRKLIDRLVGGK